jgi:excisionase family DNA binding protein
MSAGCDPARLVEFGAMDLPDAVKLTGLGRSFLYDLMSKGALRYTKIGRTRSIPRSELTRLLASGLVGAEQGASA